MMMSGGVRRSSRLLHTTASSSENPFKVTGSPATRKSKNARKLTDVLEKFEEEKLIKIGRQRKATRNTSDIKLAVKTPCKAEVGKESYRGKEDRESEVVGGKSLKTRNTTTGNPGFLFFLPELLVKTTFIRRPSARNKSPYVGDIQLPCGREAIGHFPSLELGGKCIPGSVVYVKPARDSKGQLVGPDARSPKYDTPKCEYICQLVENLEPENAPGGCLIGAHPRLGEMVALSLLEPGKAFEPLSPVPITSIRKEPNKVAGCNMKSDILVEFEDGTATLVEVKTVVDTDYAPKTAPVVTEAESKKRCVFIGPDSQEKPYRRAGIFPWGKKTQRLDDHKKGDSLVVSARAIRHVQELTMVAKGERTDAAYPNLSAAVIFIVARKDAEYFRVNHDACPAFARVALEAHKAGVKILAPLVSFEVDEADGAASAVYLGQLPVEWDQVPLADDRD